MNPINVIKKVIFEKDLKKQAVAAAINLTPQQFSDLLSGRRLLRQEDIIPLCEALEISPNELYGFKTA
ncbi:MAG: helix-turn-helix domain-containing protein [Candidatus Ornithomonoglobus sp.]